MRNLTLIAVASTLLLAAVIGYLTLTPSALLPSVSGSDKLHHVLAFTALAFPTALMRPRYIAAVALVLAAYGGVIEVIQPYFSRSRDLADWYADLLGIGAGTLLGLCGNRVLRRNILKPQL